MKRRIFYILSVPLKNNKAKGRLQKRLMVAENTVAQGVRVAVEAFPNA